MLKTLNTKSAEFKKGGIGVGEVRRTQRDGKCKIDKSGIDDNEVADKIDDEVEKKSWNPFKSKNLSKSKKTKSGFLIFEAKIAFTILKQAFIKTRSSTTLI